MNAQIKHDICELVENRYDHRLGEAVKRVLECVGELAAAKARIAQRHLWAESDAMWRTTVERERAEYAREVGCLSAELQQAEQDLERAKRAKAMAIEAMKFSDMTKPQLAAKILAYLATLDDNRKDEIYNTPRGFAQDVLEQFAEFVGVDLRKAERQAPPSHG